MSHLTPAQEKKLAIIVANIAVCDLYEVEVEEVDISDYDGEARIFITIKLGNKDPFPTYCIFRIKRTGASWSFTYPDYKAAGWCSRTKTTYIKGDTK